MQTVKRREDFKYVSPILYELDSLYTRLSDKDAKKPLIEATYDKSLESITRLFEVYSGLYTDLNFVDKKYPKIDISKFDPKNIIVCFSGGKDSIVTAKHYQKLGYNVFLYHMRHINFALLDEWEKAQKIAERLGLPLYIDDIKLSGHNSYMEHPMKNIAIANGALNWGISSGIGYKIAFGNYVTSSLEDDQFEVCGSDTVEMWSAYETVIKRVIPKFKVYRFLRNLGTTLNALSEDMELLDMSVSCLCRSNLRSYRWGWIKSKFGIELPKYRCGNCYKCCVEYIYLADHDKIEYSEDYYKYCLGQLQKVLKSEGYYNPSIVDVWNEFMFYKINKSKYNIV